MPSIEHAGARICYTRTGGGPAVLLIQGVGLEGRAWEPQVKALAQWFTVVHFDHRGIGGSSEPGRGLTIETMAQDALAIMDAEGIARFHVVGHSMGGVVAQELALRAPQRVERLSLLCTFVRGRDALRFDRTLLRDSIRSRIGSRTARRSAFLRMIVPDAVVRQTGEERLHGQLSALFGRDLADQPAIAMQQLRALSRYDASARLGALDGIPTLVMSGELDRIAPAAGARALAAAIPGARYVELPGAGHAVPAYLPATVNDLLLRHLLRVDEEWPDGLDARPSRKERSDVLRLMASGGRVCFGDDRIRGAWRSPVQAGIALTVPLQRSGPRP